MKSANPKATHKGYVVFLKDGEKMVEVHYAAPLHENGPILVSPDLPLGVAHFGPKDSDMWGHASALPEHAEFIGFYRV